MSKIIQPKDFTNGTFTGKFITEIVAKFLTKLFDLKKVNRIYRDNMDKVGIEFINSVISSLDIDFEIDAKEFKHIPKTGPFITVSNYPLGGIDGLLIMKMISEIRPDYKFLANHSLNQIKPINDLSIPITDARKNKKSKLSFSGIKKARQHLQTGNSLGIFPAGKASTYNRDVKIITDEKWSPLLIKFIKKAEVPVIPIFFQDTNSIFYHILGSIHPLLQAIRLEKELFNKKNSKLKIRIGRAISTTEQAKFPDNSVFSRFLRAKTYALGTALDVNKYFSPNFTSKLPKAEEIIPPVSPELITKEINTVKKDYLLFSNSNYDVICAPYNIMPDVLTEIGRLREITFRDIGEGTNKSSDIDEFDLYYHHLIIWDNTENKIVGAYRVGMGQNILKQYGISGFYIHSLFNIKEEFEHTLSQTLELGRSFITQEYQRKPLSLFLLWKGILYLLLKNSDYRYIIGPVSISNEFSKISKGLIVEFFRTNYFNKEVANNIEPKNKFKIPIDYNIDNKVFLKDIGSNINKLDKYIKEIEPQFSMPVLFKKYIGMGAKVIGFNIDPKFNNCLDGLILLDIFDIPPKTLKSLSKEINDDKVLERFKIDKYRT